MPMVRLKVSWDGHRRPAVPSADFYKGLELPEAIRVLARHHFEPENRHISAYEYELLRRAADLLEGHSRGRARSA